MLKDCKCNHCQEKLEQINRSKVYWENLILRKKTGIVSLLNPL